MLLNPNEIYEQDKSGHISVKDDNVGKYTSWIHGIYIYEDERLDVILKRIERYYGKEIVTEPAVAGIICSGKLDLKENVEDVLTFVSIAVSVKYTKVGEKYIIH